MNELRAGRPGAALIAFRSALHSHPATGAGLGVLTIQAQLERGDLDGAATTLRQTLRDFPGWFEHPFDVRLVYETDEQVEGQQEQLQAASASADVALLHGYLLSSSGDREQGINLLRGAATEHPDDLEIRVLLFRLQGGR